MNKFLIDASILMAHFNNDENTSIFINNLLDRGAVPVISAASILDLGKKVDIREEKLKNLLGSLSVLPISLEVSLKSAEFAQENYSMNDIVTLVSATAYVNQCVIITHEAEKYSNFNILCLSVPVIKK